MKDLSREDIIQLKKTCSDLCIGGMCYENCPHRENGMCEISYSKVIELAIKYLKEDTDEIKYLKSLNE